MRYVSEFSVPASRNRNLRWILRQIFQMKLACHAHTWKRPIEQHTYFYICFKTLVVRRVKSTSVVHPPGRPIGVDKMAIIHWPDDVSPQNTVMCVICGENTQASRVSAGMRDAHGQQAFACDHHVKEHRLFTGWSNYAAKQRQQPQENEFDDASGNGNEYFLY